MEWNWWKLLIIFLWLVRSGEDGYERLEVEVEMWELISLSHFPSSAPARIKSAPSEGCWSQPGSPHCPGEEERPGWWQPAGSPDLRSRPRPVTGHSHHRPAVLPLYLVHHHQPPRLTVHLPCKHHQLLHPWVCRTQVSNHNHHLSRRGSTATILHQHPQQSRDLNNYQNYQENKNHQLPYLVLRRSSCDPENNNNIINNDPVTSYTTTALTTEWKGSFNSLFQINNVILIYFPLQFFSLQRELQSNR